MLACFTEKGSFFLEDVRARQNAMRQDYVFGRGKGTLTSLSKGQNQYQLYCGSSTG